jgi:hypothetical protein
LPSAPLVVSVFASASGELETMRTREYKPTMAPEKDWKFIQDLAAAIEESMLPPGAIVTSPDRKVWDYDTESFSEVDVSIRYKLGSAEILVVMECRDRSRTDDKTWIEQLVGRKTAFRANVMIAVSASGFGAPAQMKARKCGIELRHVENIEDVDADQLLRVVTARYLTFQVMGINMVWPGGEYPKGVPKKLTIKLSDAWRSPILVEGAGPERTKISLNDMMADNRAWKDLENVEIPVGESIQGILGFTPEPDKGLYFEYAGKDYPVEEAQFIVKTSHIVEATTLDKLYQYASPGKRAIVHVGRGQLKAGAEPIDFIVVREPQSGKVTFTHLEKKPWWKRKRRKRRKE